MTMRNKAPYLNFFIKVISFALLSPPVNISHLALRENDNRQRVMQQLKISLELEEVERGRKKREGSRLHFYLRNRGLQELNGGSRLT